MKTFLLLFSLPALVLTSYAQVEVDKSIQLTGGTGERNISNLELPVNGTDAANKDYVDNAVSASGSSGPIDLSNESASALANFGDALRYCNSSTEGGFSDWYLPTFDEITYLMSKGGITVSNNTSANSLWTRTKMPNGTGTTSSFYTLTVVYFRMSNGETGAATASGTGSMYVRCVR